MPKSSNGSSMVFRNIPTGCEGAGTEKKDISGRQDSMYRGTEGRDYTMTSCAFLVYRDGAMHIADHWVFVERMKRLLLSLLVEVEASPISKERSSNSKNC